MAAPVHLGDVSAAPAITGYECAARKSSLPPLSQYVMRNPPHVALALIHHGGAVHALYDVCPHKAGQMSLGDIEDAADGHGMCLKCPRHRKKFPGGLNFDVRTGQSWVRSPAECLIPYDSSWCLPVFDVQVHGDYVYVSVEPKTGVIPPPGVDGDEDAPPSAASASAAPAAAAPLPVHATQRHHGVEGSWRPCRITSRTRVTHDSSLYVLQPANDEVVAPSAADRSSWHVQLRLVQGSDVIDREYTPVSGMNEWEGASNPVLRLLIKHYPRGALTARLSGLTDEQLATAQVWVSPAETTLSLPSMLPVAQGALSPAGGDAAASRGVLLIGGGTGVTPVLQLLRWCVTDASTAPVFVIMSQHSVEDMLCEPELAQAIAAAPGRAQLLYLLTRGVPANDALTPRGEVAGVFQAHGRVRASVLTRFLGAAAPLRRVVVSGPRGMYESCVEALVAAGFPAHIAVELEA